MKKNPMRQWGIRQQVLLLGLLPLLLMGSALTAYTIDARIGEAQAHLEQKAQIQANYLAIASELALYAQDQSTLRKIALKAAEDPDIADVIFLDAQGVLITRSNPNLAQRPASREASPAERFTLAQLSPKQWVVRSEIRSSQLPIDDAVPFHAQGRASTREPQLLGWIWLVISNQQTQALQTKILKNSVLIALAGLISTWMLALHLGRRITQPILRLKTRMDELERGGEFTRSPSESRSPGELGMLEQGFEHLGSWVRQTNEELEARVSQATQDLNQTLSQLERRNQELDGARQRAEEASQAKDHFVARMSHELRTPLTSILGFLDLLRQTNLNTEQREFSVIIQRTSKLLLSLIDDILDYAKLQSEALQLEKLAFNLERCLEDVIEMEAPQAHEKGLDLILQYDNQIPERLIGDPTRISQILTNLLSNAIKFTETGQVVITVSLQQQGRCCALKLQVRDTGVGISKQSREKLFAPFTQADVTITRRFGGTGLGLVICHKLVKLMQGEIEVYSQPGQGTEVIVTFALESALPCDPPPQPSLRRAVVYDDNPAGGRALELLMRRWNNEVVVCHDHQELPNLVKHQDEQPAPAMVVIGLRDGALDDAFIQQVLFPLHSAYGGPICLLVRGTAADNPLPNPLQQFPVTALFNPYSRRKLLDHLRNLQASSPTATQDQSIAHAPLTQLKHLHLLVAEDNAFNRLLLSKLLGKLGVQHTCVRNGLEAFLACQQQHFDLLIIDVHMPLMDGSEAAAKIRQISHHYKEIPIIALTADVLACEREELRRAEITQVLFKPIDEQRLIECLLQPKASAPSPEPIDSPPANLHSLGISRQEFYQELANQLTALQSGFQQGDKQRLREHSHQLLGLAGLFELPELEVASIAFNDQVKQGNQRQVWKQLWRLQRIMKSYLPGQW